MLWCAASTLLVSFERGTIVAVLVAVSCVLVAPGLVFVLLIRLPGFALATTVVLLVGMGVGVLVPAAFLYAHAWSPDAAFAVIVGGTILAASAGLVYDAVRPRRRSPHTWFENLAEPLGGDSGRRLSAGSSQERRSSSRRAERPT
jgi:O-antigen/teichoic acid export membrane protein